jgi:hypothetical protein
MTSVRWSDYSAIPVNVSLEAVETLYAEEFCARVECPPECKIALVVGPADEEEALRIKERSAYPFVVRLNPAYGPFDWRLTDDFYLCQL